MTQHIICVGSRPGNESGTNSASQQKGAGAQTAVKGQKHELLSFHELIQTNDTQLGHTETLRVSHDMGNRFVI
ncbi:hypothetical protein GTH01_09840 [Gluconobacter thailandicus F149-1 = NBRC 100600]|nr:hypothetical protein GTH01_09840 [Gluconobacter thailandicus F149-1 = NBRC 100600]